MLRLEAFEREQDRVPLVAQSTDKGRAALAEALDADLFAQSRGDALDPGSTAVRVMPNSAATAS